MGKSGINQQFNEIVNGLELDNYRDPIELAADDFRVQQLVYFTLKGDTTRIGDLADYRELFDQIGASYDLSEAELSVAVDLCEDRILFLEKQNNHHTTE